MTDPVSKPAESPSRESEKPVYIKVDAMRSEGEESSCLRPLGLCDLGGCCDVCWYNPERRRQRAQQR